MSAIHKPFINQSNRICLENIVEKIQLDLADLASVLTFNQKIFAGVLVSSVPHKGNQGLVWMLDSLGFQTFPEINSPALHAVFEIGNNKNSFASLDEISQRNMSLLKAINQFDDLIAAANFLDCSSKIMYAALESMRSNSPTAI